ncbi:hypothetical protein Aph01nite_36580 [Acrocarpospora phusangensis]|uniref:Uncharacterized protein n=1 Tax=Acrocarpospora phusangensis TaxID=1070424 RepID=A0A919QDB0_9ACTN|nr:hypothetical protein [Acrocarpospora phusangensis]GIH25348.1 hypothetical protein Aph01nite_36580 [Acrocarpospora phusangensis]
MMPRELPGFVGREALRARIAATSGVTADPEPGTDEYQVIDWLTRLHLLHGVPFAYLVPDIRMLPMESIRFFQVDNAWVEALLDGAFSVGATRATADAGEALRAAAVPAARARLGRVRADLLGDQAPAAAPEAISGFLLRSAAVSGWPGLEVRGYADADATQPLPLLRLERMAPALLLCLLGGVLRRVELREPPEGVHFGLDPASGGGWQKQLRYAAGPGTGGFIDGAVQPVTLRAGSTTVVKTAALAQAMSSRVWPSPTPATEFSAAQFGLEMVEGVQSVSFETGS